MYTLVGHHAAQALLVAPHAAVNLSGFAAEYLVGPVRIGNQLAAHGGAVDAPGAQLLLNEIRVVQPAHTADRQPGQSTHLVTEGKKTSLPGKIRVVGRGNCVAEGTVIGQRYVKTGHAGLLQQRDKDRQLLCQDPGVAVMRIFLPHRQFVVDGHVGQPAANGTYHFHRKPCPVFRAAAIFIGAVVIQCGGKTAAHPVPVYLHHVKASLPGQYRRFAKCFGDRTNLLLRQTGDVGAHLFVQKRAKLLRADPPGENSGNVLEHSFPVGIRLVQLGAQQAAFLVYGISHAAVKGTPLGRVQRGAKAVPRYRHIAHNDHGASARGNAAQGFPPGFGAQSHGGGRKDHPVL